MKVADFSVRQRKACISLSKVLLTHCLVGKMLMILPLTEKLYQGIGKKLNRDTNLPPTRWG